MNSGNQNCSSSQELREYRHIVYAVVYSFVLVFGLLGNLLALWMLRAYVKETKKAVMFMINLAVADLLQVTLSPLLLPYILKKCNIITLSGRILNQEINSKNVQAHEPISYSERGVCVCVCCVTDL